MCKAERDQTEVLCGGDNLSIELLQEAAYESRFKIDFQFGFSTVPGCRTFRITDLDEHVEAATQPTVGVTRSQMLIVNLFGCNYRAKSALKGWHASQFGCDVTVFHKSYQARNLCNCGQISVGVSSVLQNSGWSFPSNFESFDEDMKAVATACNSNTSDRAATNDLDLENLIEKKIGSDSTLWSVKSEKDNGVLNARSFLETIHTTTRWHKCLRSGEQPKPLCMIMNTDIEPNPAGLGHWVVVLLRSCEAANPDQSTASSANKN